MPAVTFSSPCYHFDSIDSTMREAADRAEAGAPEGTLTLADAQTAGRGRLGRTWISEPGVGLYFSIVLRPAVPLAQLPALTLALGLGVAHGIEQACGVECDLRWPNDVLIRERKCAGILVESSIEENRVRYAVAGVGINVNHASLPPEIADSATSIRIETGREYLPETVLDAVLRQSERYYEMFRDGGPRAIVERFAGKSSYARGKKVIVYNETDQRSGVTAGLDPNGILLLETPEGRIEPILAGSVRAWTPPADESPAH
jgi:BirA family biotin operon repressor/biotin-[acetyl-CoA-carboxylase] ligase